MKVCTPHPTSWTRSNATDRPSIAMQQTSQVTITSVDRAAFYQLKTMLQGVLARGTARAIAGLSPYVAGKTGTSDDENDAWFVGFTNDVTGGGLDRLRQRRRQAPHARRRLDRRRCRGADLRAGDPGGVGQCRAESRARPAVARGQAPACVQIDRSRVGRSAAAADKAITECFRVDTKGKVVDTRFRLVSREGASDWQESLPRSKVEKTIKPANELVARFSQIEGYRCLSLTRASGVVKCQFALVC